MGAGDRILLDRRKLLRGIGASATILMAPPTRAAEPEITTINSRLSVIGGLGGNIVLAHDAGSSVLVDSGAAANARTLIEAVGAITGSTGVGTLFNSHWHLDQVGANADLRVVGAEIIAHVKTLAHLAVPYYLPSEDRYQPAAPVGAHPTITFHDDGEIEAAGQQIRYGYLLEAHTDGDIYTQFVDDNVIAVGDSIAPDRDPIFDWFGGGWVGGRIDSLELLLRISDAATRFVPSYGPTVNRRYVEAEHELMLGLYDILWTRVRAGESAEDILASGALDALPRRFDDPARLLYDAHKSMWAHYNTLSPDIV
jgi:glyoxylase-like metal-dependent hydrolase (beta-lactamase superfamily II)